MKRYFSFPFISILFLLIILSGCGYQPLQIKSINSVDYQNKGKDGTKIKANITFLNPNRAKFFIDSLNVDVLLGDNKLGKLQAPDLIMVPKKSEFSTDFVVNIPAEAILKSGFVLLKAVAVGKIELTLKGKMQIQYGIIDREIPINHVEEVKLK